VAQKFLIIRLSSIGDIVLTTPIIRCLHKKYPDAAIHFLTKKKFAPILQYNPYINKVHTLDDDFDLMLQEVEKESFDYIIDLHHNIRTLKVKRHLKKATSFSLNKLNVQKFIYTSFKINILPQKHIVDREFECVKKLGITNDEMGLDYFIPEADKIKKNDIPTSHQLGYIAISIGAALVTKKMPLQKLQQLCASIHHPIILLGGLEDFDDGKAIAAQDDIKIYNACGKFNLNESADIISNAKLLITHDTGLMHIAAAFQKPIVSIWGNTVPAFGMYPYYGTKSSQKYDVVQVNNLRCRPCSKIGYDKCPKGHFKCMQQININEIIELVKLHLTK
jgi:ADP-heptose:LPS heptosyltransferase